MIKENEQLCWDCQRAIGGCPWSDQAVPVDGWSAEKTKIPNGCNGEFVDSYKITACPLFLKDPVRMPVVLEGERISLNNLSKYLGVSGQALKSYSDEQVIKSAEEKGIILDVKYQKKRYFFVKKVKHGLLRKL